jgi:hypothetical protein
MVVGSVQNGYCAAMPDILLRFHWKFSKHANTIMKLCRTIKHKAFCVKHEVRRMNLKLPASYFLLQAHHKIYFNTSVPYKFH